MNSSTILKYWHYAGIVATVTGVAAQELTPLAAAWPKAAAVVTGLGAISLGITSAMNKLANDKVVAAIINDPSSPTPQGLGIPTPIVGQASEMKAAAIQAANANPVTIEAISQAAIAQNVVDHANAVLDATK